MSNETGPNDDEPNAFELEFIANDGKVGAYEAAMATFGPNEPDAAFKVMGEIRYWANRAIWRNGYQAGLAARIGEDTTTTEWQWFDETNGEWSRCTSHGMSYHNDNCPHRSRRVTVSAWEPEA